MNYSVQMVFVHVNPVVSAKKSKTALVMRSVRYNLQFRLVAHVFKKKYRVDYFVISLLQIKILSIVHVFAFSKSTLHVNFNFFAHLFPKKYWVDYCVITGFWIISLLQMILSIVHVFFSKNTSDVNFNFFAHLFPKNVEWITVLSQFLFIQ